MTTILVSGASGVVGYGTLKSLRAAGPYKLIGTSIYDDSVAPAFCDIFEQAPKTTDDGYIDWLLNIIDRHQVSMIIPGIEIDMQTWSQNRKRIDASGVKALLNNPKLTDLCSDKWSFYETLQGSKSPLAIESTLSGSFEKLKEKFGLPFLLKPRHGYASKGIVMVDSKDTFQKHEKELGNNLMAQPIVGDQDHEYTISAFFDTEGNLCCLMALQRKLSSEGFTEKARVVDVPGAKKAIIELARIFKPIGPTNFQFRLHDGQLKLLEINPRISSATAIRTAFGYNESAMSVEYFLEGKLPKQPEIKQGYAVRYTEEHIFYDRDHI